MLKTNKPRYKVCLQLNENIWNNEKILKFKKNKWIKLNHRLKKNRNNFRKILNNLKFLIKKLRIYNLYKLTLNFNKKLKSFYGPINKKFLNKILLKSKSKSLRNNNIFKNYKNIYKNL